MGKMILSLSLLVSMVHADCAMEINSAYRIGTYYAGGVMNAEHAERICSIQLSAASLVVNNVTMTACYMGLDAYNPNKDLQGFINRVCYGPRY